MCSEKTQGAGEGSSNVEAGPIGHSGGMRLAGTVRRVVVFDRCDR
jgi:hypothetical protein